MNPKALSLQEEEELIRGNKKIEDRHHASFKDKVIGEILGAYTEAFNFIEMEDDDAKSDDDVQNLWASFAAVKLSKSTKRWIWASWSKLL